MIETMMNVTIAAPGRGKEAMLLALREAGLVHIKELKPSCDESVRLTARAHELTRALNAITDEAGKELSSIKQEGLGQEDFDKMAASVLEAIDFRRREKERHLSIVNEITKASPWGDYEPDDVRDLAAKGHAFDFYTVDAKSLPVLREDKDLSYILLDSEEGTAYIAVIGGEVPSGCGARQYNIPSLSLRGMVVERDAAAKNIKEASARIKEAAKYVDAFKLQLRLLEQDAMFERVKATSKDEVDGRICLISGYVPEDRVEEVKSLASSRSWGYLVKEVEEDEEPPTKLKFRGLVRIMQPIYNVLGTLPGYREKDISFWFLIYFSIFFAMIIGDAGYGLLFLAIAVVMNVKTKRCSDINILLYVLSAVTIAWGAITGTWFGSLAVLEKLPFLQVFIVPSMCNYSQELFGIDPVYVQDNTMQLCFILGASQLGLACVINVIDKAKVKDLSLFGDIGWFIDVCVLYMMALYLVIGAEVNFSIVVAGIVVGFVLVVVFGSQAPGQSFAKGLKSGLGGFFTSFLDTVSCFSNIMSYIRLFAVGMASLAIAQSFNNMAGMAGPVFGALIVILGTLLNMVMGLLSVIVHGVRLNLLEFSGQLGMEWTGYKYEPFARTVSVNENASEEN